MRYIVKILFMITCYSCSAQKQPHDISIDKGLDKHQQWVMISDTNQVKYHFGKFKCFDWDSTKQTITTSVIGDYYIWVGIISQSDTDPPTAVVLQNTLPESVHFSYGAPGVYALECADSIFSTGKTVVFPPTNTTFDEDGVILSHVEFGLAQPYSVDISNSTADGPKNDFGPLPIEIRIYKH